VKPASRFANLDDWLRWQETLHPRAIDLGLDRLRVVAGRLGLQRPGATVVTVGGTNGKGSCVALLEAILRASGKAVGCYTSPHLLRYNERLRFHGRPIGDEALCAAFQRVDQARDDLTLTYFEFGTLAALVLMQDTQLDVALLEVGLGGRLDAVNLVDADVALVVTVDLDHQEWLGPDRDSIGREKAGIFRPGRPAVVAESDAPRGLLQGAQELGAQLLRRGVDFDLRRHRSGHWDWLGSSCCLPALPPPALPGDCQIDNAAAVLAVLHCGVAGLEVSRSAIEQGLCQARLAGRVQTLPGEIPCIVDVAHNPQAVRALARELAANPVPGRTLAVVGMLVDKDAQTALAAVSAQVDAWYLAALPGVRGQTAEALAENLRATADRHPLHCFADVSSAELAARGDAQPGDRLVVLGSFHTAAAVLQRRSVTESAAAPAVGV
jgi:dihydrofolate synthase/folylpolyglutamate synthase